MVSDEALKKLQEQIAAWPMERRFVVQQLIRDYLRNREDLRAYEATGLTAEQCTNAKTIVESAFSDDTSKAERIRELLKADKDGRVVELPCKVGDTVYCCNGSKYIIDFEVVGFSVDDTGAWLIHAEHHDDEKSTSYGYSLDTDKIGKTVFLTREAAEAALNAREG